MQYVNTEHRISQAYPPCMLFGDEWKRIPLFPSPPLIMCPSHCPQYGTGYHCHLPSLVRPPCIYPMINLLPRAVATLHLSSANTTGLSSACTLPDTPGPPSVLHVARAQGSVLCLPSSFSAQPSSSQLISCPWQKMETAWSSEMNVGDFTCSRSKCHQPASASLWGVR